jgi:hypothetical protein
VAEGLGKLLLCERQVLRHGLREIAEGVGGPGLDVALSHGGEEVGEGGIEVAGGGIFAGEIGGDVRTELFGGAGLGVFAGVIGAECRMVRGTEHAAAAAVGKIKRASRGKTVNRGRNRHRYLRKVKIWLDLGMHSQTGEAQLSMRKSIGPYLKNVKTNFGISSGSPRNA